MNGPVKEYFLLQYKMMNRRLKDQGLEPLLAYIIIGILFYGLSYYLFYKTPFAPYIYFVIALTTTGRLSQTRRTDFLRSCFGSSRTMQLRAAENVLAVLPFLIFLLYHLEFLIAAILLLAAVALSLLNFRNDTSLVIPTPFSKKPFEFSTGFRNGFVGIMAAYALTVIAAAVDNFNLGIFSLLLLFAVMLSFYGKAENEYYVWIYRSKATTFLYHKIKQALLFSFLLALPLVLMLAFFFSQHILVISLCLLLGFAYLLAIIVSKYASFPNDMNITQGIILGLCIAIPPLLLVMIPYLFFKSEKRLREILQ